MKFTKLPVIPFDSNMKSGFSDKTDDNVGAVLTDIRGCLRLRFLERLRIVHNSRHNSWHRNLGTSDYWDINWLQNHRHLVLDVQSDKNLGPTVVCTSTIISSH